MPGTELADALAAARSLRSEGVSAIVTQLGENVTDAAAVEDVVAHYLSAIERIRTDGLDCYVSVKPTHLGLDLDPERCHEAHHRLAVAAAAAGNMLWIDMESSAYTDATLALFRRLRLVTERVGVCLQANLRRTGEDLAKLLPLTPSIRLVKGAYAEPAERAWTRKRDVDAAYLRHAQQLLRHLGGTDAKTGIATHDVPLIREIDSSARALGCGREAFELQMLYGIRNGARRELVADGFAVRVLISYGTHWYPWYMRRLAERPANVWFVVRSVLADR
jgi:proline dehydrogenase